MKAFTCVAALSLLAFSSSLALADTAHMLWQIGQIDRDDKEFALAPSQWAHYTDDSYYVVGQSQPGRDWTYVQPGPADGWASSRSHTASIDFALAHATVDGTCVLTLDLVDSHSAVPPRLEISVNGQTWTRDTIHGGGDDSIGGQPSHGKPSTVTVEFPADLLRAGVNKVRITTVKGSWIVYDAVTLTTPAPDTLGAAPTVLTINSAEWLHDVLKRRGSALDQILRLQFFNSGRPKSVQLHISGEADRPVTIATGHSTVDYGFPESKVRSQNRVQLFDGGGAIGEPITVDRKPCRRLTIYCLEESHMDVGYDYLQQEATERHHQYLAAGLKLNSAASSLPYDDRFRWNCESLYEVDGWLQAASPKQLARFQAAVRNGDLGLSALYCNELTGLCRPEELVSLLSYANQIRGKYQIPIDSAMISDVPGYTWGLVSVLAQSGVKYISWGPNGGDHLGYARGFDNKAFYWRSPSGKDKVLVWQSPNGYYPNFDNNDASLARFLRDFELTHADYPFDMIYDRHTHGDNGPADTDLPAFVHSWNSRYAYPHLVMSTTSRMFHDFAAKYGKTLPEMRGDYTGYWEDGAASTARETAVNRQAAEGIAQDQILYAMLDPANYPHARFDDAWKNALLYDEHTWGADRSWSEPESDFTKQQWEYKKQFALNARDQAQALQSDALKSIAAPGSNTVAVFNTSSWARTELVTLPAGQSGAGDAVRDEQARAVPSQRLKDGSLAFLAVDIPPLSSRKFVVASGPSGYVGAASAVDGMLKTRNVSLKLDGQTGAIVSWKVNGIDHDLVDSGNKTSRGLNDYLYILGPTNDNVQYAGNAKVTVVDAGPLVASVRIDSDAPGSKSLSRIVQVVDGIDEVSIADTVDKLAVHEDEAVHFGFSFEVPDAVVRMDMPWSVVRPGVDQTANANKNVFPVNRWVDVSNDTFGVTCANLDSPMMEVGEIRSPRENGSEWLQTAKRGSAIYWNVMNNYWHTNYKAYQPGAATFRYVLTAHGKYDQASAQRFGIDSSQPLVVVPVKPGQADVNLPLGVDSPAVIITRCQPDVDGKGWLIRLFNGSDQTQPVTLTWNGSKDLPLTRTDLWGNGGTAIKNGLSLLPMEIVTLRTGRR